jgi:hypothetical protein
VVYHELIESSKNRDYLIHASLDEKRKDKKKSTIKLNACFDKFVEEEKLDGIVCPKCHEDSHLMKCFILWRLPPILFIQLKRFQFDQFTRRKLNDLVDFPIDDLDVSPYIAPKKGVVDEAHPPECSKYHLYAVVHHVGIMGGGHYVASIRDNSENVLNMSEVKEYDNGTSSNNNKILQRYLSNQWWCYNDSSVTSIKPEDIVSSSAYLLFYVRDDVARGLTALEDIFTGDDFETDEEIRQQSDINLSRGAKFDQNEDITSRRYREIHSDQDIVLNSESSSKPEVHSIKDESNESKATGNNSGENTSQRPTKSNTKRKGGYTEEEFEKMMDNNDKEASCHIC